MKCYVYEYENSTFPSRDHQEENDGVHNQQDISVALCRAKQQCIATPSHVRHDYWHDSLLVKTRTRREAIEEKEWSGSPLTSPGAHTQMCISTPQHKHSLSLISLIQTCMVSKTLEMGARNRGRQGKGAVE